MTTWQPVTDTHPSEFRTVYLYRAGDLFPAVGFRVLAQRDDAEDWLHEDAGPEDGDHQGFGPIGGKGWRPTHYREIEDLPTVEP